MNVNHNQSISDWMVPYCWLTNQISWGKVMTFFWGHDPQIPISQGDSRKSAIWIKPTDESNWGRNRSGNPDYLTHSFIIPLVLYLIIYYFRDNTAGWLDLRVQLSYIWVQHNPTLSESTNFCLDLDMTWVTKD